MSPITVSIGSSHEPDSYRSFRINETKFKSTGSTFFVSNVRLSSPLFLAEKRSSSPNQRSNARRCIHKSVRMISKSSASERLCHRNRFPVKNSDRRCPARETNRPGQIAESMKRPAPIFHREQLLASCVTNGPGRLLFSRSPRNPTMCRRNEALRNRRD